jgi:hypothetical protein
MLSQDNRAILSRAKFSAKVRPLKVLTRKVLAPEIGRHDDFIRTKDGKQTHDFCKYGGNILYTI